MGKRILSVVAAAFLALGGMSWASVSAETTTTYDSADFFAQPTVIVRVEEEDSLLALNESAMPASVWVTIDSNLSVIGSGGESLGTLQTVYESSIAGKALLIVQPQDAAALDAVLGFEQSASLDDWAIASDSVAVLTTAADQSDARIYYIAGDLFGTDNCSSEIGKANVVGAQTMILSYESASAEAVRYIQARFKSVWVETDGSAVQIADALGRGAYGIVTPDAAPVYALYERLNGGEKEDASSSTGRPYLLSRAPFVAAHRGDWGVLYSENTVGAIEQAAKNGATHVEIDIRLTADKQIVVFHNDNAVYNGNSIPVSSLTLEQIREIKLSDGISQIPTLDEVFESAAAGNTGDLIFIIEFKGREAELVSLFREKVTQYDLVDQVVVISFYPEQVLRVAEQLPSVPTSYLLYSTGGASAIEQAQSVGSGIDMQHDYIRQYYGDGSYVSSYNEMFRQLADRGYSFWMWTYDTDSMSEALRYGVTGITTNDCWVSAAMTETLLPQKEYLVSELPAENSEIEIDARNYRGESTSVSARILYLEKGEEEATAILVTQPESGFALVSETVTFVLEDATSQGACTPAPSAAGAAALGAAALGAAACGMIRKKEN